MPKMETRFAEVAAPIWDKFAEAFESHFLEDSDWVHERLILGEGEWKVALDYHSIPGYHSATHHTRFHAPYYSDNQFCCMLRHETLEDRMGKLFGLQDIQVGDPVFDPKFLIQSNYDKRFKAILQREKLRELLLEEPEAVLQLHGDHGYWDHHFHPTTRDFSIEVPGHVTDVERLRRMYDLLAEALIGTCETRGQQE